MKNFQLRYRLTDTNMWVLQEIHKFDADDNGCEFGQYYLVQAKSQEDLINGVVLKISKHLKTVSMYGFKKYKEFELYLDTLSIDELKSLLPSVYETVILDRIAKLQSDDK